MVKDTSGFLSLVCREKDMPGADGVGIILPVPSGTDSLYLLKITHQSCQGVLELITASAVTSHG